MESDTGEIEVTCNAALEIPKKLWVTARFVGWGSLPPKKEDGIEVGGKRIKWRFDIVNQEYEGIVVLSITSQDFDTGSRGGKILKALGVTIGEGGVKINSEYVRQNLVGRKVMMLVTSKQGQEQMEYWLADCSAIAVTSGTSTRQADRGPRVPPPPPPEGSGDPSSPPPPAVGGGTPVSDRRADRGATGVDDASGGGTPPPPADAGEHTETARAPRAER